jgi:phage-related protein
LHCIFGSYRGIGAFSQAARLEAGLLLARLQEGEMLAMPVSRPLPTLASRCHELRIKDGAMNWRIVYRLDSDAVLILEVFLKKTRRTPTEVLNACKARMRQYDSLCGADHEER